MEHWTELLFLLKEEAELWQRVQKQLEAQRRALQAEEPAADEIERLLTEREQLQTLLAQRQERQDQLKIELEAAKEEPTVTQQAELEQILQNRSRLHFQQEEIIKLEKELEKELQVFGERQRNQIREGRSKKAIRQSYQAIPISGESALLDQKK